MKTLARAQTAALGKSSRIASAPWSITLRRESFKRLMGKVARRSDGTGTRTTALHRFYSKRQHAAGRRLVDHAGSGAEGIRRRRADDLRGHGHTRWRRWHGHKSPH